MNIEFNVTPKTQKCIKAGCRKVADYHLIELTPEEFIEVCIAEMIKLRRPLNDDSLREYVHRIISFEYRIRAFGCKIKEYLQ